MTRYNNRSGLLPYAVVFALAAALASLTMPFPPIAHAEEGGDTVLYVESYRDVANRSSPMQQGPATPDRKGDSGRNPNTADASPSPLACAVIGTCALAAGMSAKMRPLVRRAFAHGAPGLRRLFRIL